MAEEKEKIDFTLILKSGLGVAILSIGGYLVGFAYEKGYADYFGIPSQLIKLNLTNIFISIFGVVASMLSLFTIINGFYRVFKSKSIFVRAIIRIAPSVLLSSAVIYIYRNTVWRNIIMNILYWPASMLFLEFVVPLLNQRGKGTYFQKMEAQEEIIKQKEPTFLWDLIAYKRSLLIISYLITAILLLYVFANRAGATEAMGQKSFLVARAPQQLVVLRIYGDKFICAPFDSKARTVEKTLYILDTPKQDGIWLDWQEVGPLKLVDKKVPDVNN